MLIRWFQDSTPQTTVANSRADLRTDADKTARGEQTAENIRFGESISEHGFGGETGPKHGGAGLGTQETKGGDEDRAEDDAARTAQGYGEGSGVGA
jgi:hypothetical protein